MKKVVSIILILSVVLSIVPFKNTVRAQATDLVWDGSTADSFEGGTGTENDPYRIATAEQLAYFAASVNAGTTFSGRYIALTDDIYLNDTDDYDNWGDSQPQNAWTPIGKSQSLAFSGNFDGQGHLIQGLYCSRNGLSGLFGTVSAESEIKDLRIEKAYVSGTYAGGLVAYITIPKKTFATISNISFSGTVSASSDYAGGIFAWYDPVAGLGANPYGCNISNCRVYGDITGKSYVGGIGGYTEGSITITECVVYADIVGSGNKIGGVTGCCNSKISDCAVFGSVTGASQVGGICGYSSGGETTTCINYATIKGTSNIGGIWGHGYSYPAISECINLGNIIGTTHVAGIIGYLNAGGKVANCYNTGTVTGTGNYIGGIAGECYQNGATATLCYNSGLVNNGKGPAVCSEAWLGGSISYCYFNEDSGTGGNGIALTANQMAAETSFTGFDFDSVWTMDASLRRPVLKNNLEIYDIKRADGFNFYLNCPTNYLCIGSTADMHIGYYLDDTIANSEKHYIYTVSNSDVIDVTDVGWSNKYGQKIKITAKCTGSSIISVTNPLTEESSSIEIHVTPAGTAWDFYHVPKMTIESGKTTNFYNYSGLVVDDFSYTEHKNSSGITDYYNVTMTIWNSVNLYGAVTSHNPDGSIYSYDTIDKMSEFETSFVENLKSLYYTTGDLFYLIKNKQYYSGKSCTTENHISIDVPIGGYLSISNNVAVSDMANIVNYVSIVFDVVSLAKDLVSLTGSDKYVIENVKTTVLNNILNKIKLGNAATNAIDSKVSTAFKKSCINSLDGLTLNNENLFHSLIDVADELVSECGFNIIEELEKEICSVTGIASLGESITTKILPTGWIINAMYTANDGLNLGLLLNEYRKSPTRPGGIYIYAPSESSNYQSNGISIDTQDDMSETIVHAYTVADTGSAGINKNTFADEATYYSDKYQTYNITLYKNGVETQPNSTVTVRIPIPSNFSKSNQSALKVYRNNEDGTLTNMNARVEGNYMVFETDHFSYYSIVDESIPTIAEDLKFSGASLTLQDNLTINYKVNKELFDINGYTQPYVEFVMNGKKTVVTAYEVVGNKYVFTFTDIAPNLMNDTVYATLYAQNNGLTYFSATREYSVAEYCYSMLELYAADEYAELRTLLVDLLHYGAASQTYTGYRTDTLVNASLTDVQLQWGTSEEPALNTVLDTTYKTVENPTAKWKGAGLTLQDSVSIRLKFETDSIEDLSVVAENGTSKWTIFSDQFVEEDGVYYVYFSGLDAGQMRQSVYLTIYDGDTPVSNTVCYSIGSYAYEKQNSTIAGLPELVKAMMKYGDSANAYVH